MLHNTTAIATWAKANASLHSKSAYGCDLSLFVLLFMAFLRAADISRAVVLGSIQLVTQSRTLDRLTMKQLQLPRGIPDLRKPGCVSFGIVANVETFAQAAPNPNQLCRQSSYISDLTIL
jgi:hypothetical protein